MSDTSRTLSLSDISPVCLLRMIGRHLWMVAASALIFAMGALLYRQWLCPPVYRATMTYAVTSRKTGYTSQANLTAAREVAAVLSELLETDVVTDSLKTSSEKLRHFDGNESGLHLGLEVSVPITFHVARYADFTITVTATFEQEVRVAISEEMARKIMI